MNGQVYPMKIKMASIAVLLIVLLGLISVGAGQAKPPAGKVSLVKDGASGWHVSLAPGHSKIEALAASEFATYVRKISGAELKIVDEAKPSEHAVRFESAGGKLDGFDITASPKMILVKGHTPRGALYGSYQLLEDMGCRWFYIGELGEVVPANKNIDLPAGKRVQRASFPERSVTAYYDTYYANYEDWIKFLARMRINNIYAHANGSLADFVKRWKEARGKYIPLLEERGMTLEWGGHHLPALVPRELFKEHPEYFRVDEKGVRSNDLNFCPNSGAIEVLKKNVRPILEQLPEVTNFNFYADDLMEGGWCHCPKCKDLTTADQNMLAMNAVAGVLAEVNPKAAVGLAAYHDYEKVSKFKPAPNLYLLDAPRERCYAHAFNDPKCRRNHDEYVKPWMTLRAEFEKTAPQTIHSFQYYTDGILNREMQPPFVEVIPADARYFRSLQLPVYQNLMVAFRDWVSPPFSLVNFSRAAWNADVNGWEVLDDFCGQYYGKPLKAEMAGYYRTVEKACNFAFEIDSIVGPTIDMTWPPSDPAMRKPLIENAKRARALHAPLPAKLDALIAKCPDGMIKQRLQLERKVCGFHQDVIEFADTHYEGQFLAEQYLAGAMGQEAGRKAVARLDECLKTVEKLKPWNSGYYGQYTKAFGDLSDKVKARLALESKPKP